jgi:hypothetical protein
VSPGPSRSATLVAAQLVLGRDRHCLNYTRPFRVGLLGRVFPVKPNPKEEEPMSQELVNAIVEMREADVLALTRNLLDEDASALSLYRDDASRPPVLALACFSTNPLHRRAQAVPTPNARRVLLSSM